MLLRSNNKGDEQKFYEERFLRYRRRIIYIIEIYRVNWFDSVTTLNKELKKTKNVRII